MPTVGNEGFSVGTFNILTKTFERNKYSGYCRPESKAWSYRLALYKQLIPHMNFDILAVQEARIGCFKDDFAFVRDHRYEIVPPYDKLVAKKPDVGNSLKKNGLLYRADKFELLSVDYRSRTVITALRASATDRVVFVVNCHLEGDPRKVTDRFTQLRSAFKVLQNMQTKMGIVPAEANVVVCGDFNSSRECAPHTLLSEGALPASYRDPWDPDAVITKTDYSIPYALHDAYEVTKAQRRPTFFANSRPSLIDFVFVSRALSVTSTKDPFSADQWDVISQTGAPNDFHPSDHFAIGCSVEYPRVDPSKKQSAAA